MFPFVGVFTTIRDYTGGPENSHFSRVEDEWPFLVAARWARKEQAPWSKEEFPVFQAGKCQSIVMAGSRASRSSSSMGRELPSEGATAGCRRERMKNAATIATRITIRVSQKASCRANM